ncbi:P-loop containing nucleoside triphosphate hydrolase protein [Mycotypha africana]|uniref:P-loop containing nucleoside triphosphate hydrolase protein n=1 Tax=Mycotypha africana TaxID=64632 RepID=UPI002300403E|nr:P-loop containing nucleoside triphosphate hydrolase protein [Mycotypha africana]KAI8968482.1 P-loop containing nucleoside triphosphate hydrolase protein [Mycotypha africana]
MSYASDCYGEEGARLEQAFRLTFLEGESAGKVLIKGDSGIGKTYLVHKLALDYNVPIISAILGQLAADYHGHIVKGLKRLLWRANNEKKSILLIEDIDLFFPRQNYDFLLKNLLQTMIEECDSNHIMMLVATTRRPDDLAFEIRNLFLDEIHLQIPTPDERFKIMQHICHTNFKSHSKLQEKTIRELSSKAHAFVAADLVQWFRLAEEDALNNKETEVDLKNFDHVFDRIRVTGLQDSVMAEKPEPVYWEDIGGLTTAKQALEESVIWLYKHADAYKRLGIRPSKGMLLYGPPGTGKTLLAKAVATESAANFLPISIPDLIKGEVGESEKAVAKVFQTAVRCSPCVIFLDELEAIFASRDSSGDVGRKLISQFLIEIDHIDKMDQKVIILAATNHPESIDDSILRPGRLDRLVYVGAPTLLEKVQILKVLAQSTKVEANVDFDLIASKTEGYTGADLRAAVRKAGLLTLKQNLDEITQSNLEQALNYVTPSALSTTLLDRESNEDDVMEQ